jgi:hypothetical protein
VSGDCSRGFETGGLIRFRIAADSDRVISWLGNRAIVDLEERELLKTKRKLDRRSFAWAKSDPLETFESAHGLLHTRAEDANVTNDS